MTAWVKSQAVAAQRRLVGGPVHRRHAPFGAVHSHSDGSGHAALLASGHRRQALTGGVPLGILVRGHLVEKLPSR